MKAILPHALACDGPLNGYYIPMVEFKYDEESGSLRLSVEDSFYQYGTWPNDEPVAFWEGKANA